MVQIQTSQHFALLALVVDLLGLSNNHALLTIEADDQMDSEEDDLDDSANLPPQPPTAAIAKMFRRRRKLQRFDQFSKLPLELKCIIYEFHLTLPDKISPRRWGRGPYTLSCYSAHVRNCLLNEHEVIMRHKAPQKYSCKAPFGDNKTVHHRLTPSRLGLLLTSREVFEMAVGIFYKRNHFVFDCKYKMTHMRDFLDGIGDRRRFLAELSFQYAHNLANLVFKDLSKLQFLTKLHIVMDVESIPPSTLLKKKKWDWPRMFNGTLTEAPGIANLLKINNLEVLEISGRDRIKEDGSEESKLVDINHKYAIGPTMMRTMLSDSAYEALFGVA
ncbi:hypothetical protein MMC26_006688 [Xylographa opegraphella]|nr:hypothetical protein [Xylographa opegraphella]